MKIRVQKKVLTDAIQRLSKITARGTTQDILSGIFMHAEKTTLSARSTNLELALDVQIPVAVEREGIAAIPGEIIATYLANIPIADSSEITLERHDTVIVVSTDRGTVKIRLLEDKDFPDISYKTKGSRIVLPAQRFGVGLKAVSYAAAPTSVKAELSSIFIHNDDNYLVFAATDSFRLAEKKISAERIEKFDSLLLPIRNSAEIIRNVELVSDDATIYVDENLVTLSFGASRLTSRLIEGSFPDYKQLIPKEFVTEVIVLKKDLMDSLKVANVFSNKFNQILLSVNPRKKTFSISTENADVGESATRLDAAVSGDSLDISFNFRYIMDSFQSIPSDSVVLSFSGAGKPMVVKGVGDASFTYLVMPMNK